MSTNPIAAVTSEGTPEKGQEHRSSGDFSTETPDEPQQLQWFVSGNTNPVEFDVMKDNSLRPDSCVWSSLTNGSITSYESSRSYYIANPVNTGNPPESFVVTVWPYPNDSR